MTRHEGGRAEHLGDALPDRGDSDAAASRAAALRFRVLDADDPAERCAWREAWERWPEREVMALPEYARLFAGPEDRAVAVLAEAPGAGILLPLVLRPLGAAPWAVRGEDRWDATTPYGYGGPFAWGDAAAVAEAFWRAYEAWCRAVRLVCTFARLSLFPEQLAPVPERVEARCPNVVVPLRGGIDAVWRAYDRDVRRRLRVARRQGVTIELDPAGERVREFHEIYDHTMARRRAAPWYRFPAAFFERLAGALRGKVLFVHAVAAGRVLSSELVLASERHAYSFLGGTRSEAFRLYPNELVRHATAEWAAGAGKERYVLGGGRSEGDGVHRHKRLFAPGGDVPFRTASLVHDEAAYHALVRRRAAWEEARGQSWAPQWGFFPNYRS